VKKCDCLVKAKKYNRVFYKIAILLFLIIAGVTAECAVYPKPHDLKRKPITVIADSQAGHLKAGLYRGSENG
jgi:hypothetical protein